MNIFPASEPMTIIKEGWIWPAKDSGCWESLQREKNLPNKIAELCLQKRVVIQAGGNCGFFPKIYSEIFDVVYTFEPDPINFYCLTMNTGERLNVIKQQVCLGDDRKLINLTPNDNVGGYCIDDKNFDLGKIPTLLVDDLSLEICDLIHLDVEGWEFPVLKGSMNTLARCKPVIAIEWMDHGARFGWTQQDIERWLNDIGYKRKDKIINDMIFLPE